LRDTQTVTDTHTHTHTHTSDRLLYLDQDHSAKLRMSGIRDRSAIKPAWV